MKKSILLLLSIITFFSYTIKCNAITNITVSHGSLNPIFNRNTYVYNVFVDNLNEISVNVTKENEKEVINGHGINKLVNGENSISIEVLKGEREPIIYTINVFNNYNNKYDENDSSLKYLFISNYEINFQKNVLDYEINVVDKKQDIDVSYLTSNPNAKAIMTIESNKIEIEVVSSNKKEQSKYTIKISNPIPVISESISDEKIAEKDYSKKEITILKIVISVFVIIILSVIFWLIFLKKKFIHK